MNRNFGCNIHCSKKQINKQMWLTITATYLLPVTGISTSLAPERNWKAQNPGNGSGSQGERQIAKVDMKISTASISEVVFITRQS